MCWKGIQKLQSPIDCFQLFVTDDMLEIVVENVNTYIDTVSVNYSGHDKYKVKRTYRKWKLVLVFKSSRQNLDDLWANDETSMEIFRSTMSMQRFRFLLQCLRFDDGTTRAARSEVDKLAQGRQFFELFVTNVSHIIQWGNW
jgi:hypothetical protein